MATSVPKAEMQATIDSFFPVEEPELEVVDRSDLEDSATCPAAGAFRRSGAFKAVSAIAESSEAMHSAFGQAITEYVLSGGALSRSDLMNEVLGYLFGSRPDIQPDAIKAARASLYEWSRFIVNLHPANILRWDGGTNNRSGQLSWDMPDLGLRITSEIDLLNASPSPDLLVETDYKGGHKRWSTYDVAGSFQLGAVHPWLILNNYPTVRAVQIRVWNTRCNRVTYSVEVTREQLPAIESRIRSAAVIWRSYRDLPPEACPAWPTIEKCSQCPAAVLCPAANLDVVLLQRNEASFVDNIIATEAKLDAMYKLAKAECARLDRDLEGTNGNRFGTRKPKERAPSATTYEAKDQPEESEETE